MLIDAGADVNFDAAFQIGATDVVRDLLADGHDAGVVHCTPLRMAAFNSIPATRMLLAAGATFKMTDWDDLGPGRDFTARAYLMRVEAAGGFESYREEQYQKVLAVQLLTSDRGGRLPVALVPKIVVFWTDRALRVAF